VKDLISEPTPRRRLDVYLNDHLATETVAVELARRTRGSNLDEPEFGPTLAELCVEIEADRTTLERAMKGLGVGRGRVKPTAAWAGEKLGRLKLNGQLRGYSPLSRMVELEGLQLLTTGKLQMWRSLAETVGEVGGVDPAAQGARSARQRERLEELQLLAASRALPSASAPGPSA
jgi:hypothetical protein